MSVTTRRARTMPLVGALAIAGCRGVAAPSHSTASVVVGSAGDDAGLVVEAPKEDDRTRIRYASVRAVDWRNYDYGDVGADLHDGRGFASAHEDDGSIYVFGLESGRPALIYSDRYIGPVKGVRIMGRMVFVDEMRDGRDCSIQIDFTNDEHWYTVNCPP